MDKKSLKQQLKSHVGGASFVTCSQVEDFLKFGHEKTVSILKGLDAVEVNDRRSYFIPDVVDRLMEYKVIT